MAGLKDEEQVIGQEIHARLLARDATAPADLFEFYLTSTTTSLSRAFPNVDEHLVQDGVADALFNLAEHPERFDPSRSALATYLAMSARGDLLNLLEREKRHRAHQITLDDVELVPGNRNRVVTGQDTVSAEVTEKDDLVGLRSALDAACRTEQEQQVLHLVLEGERSTEAFSEILGIAGLPVAEQRRDVKRVKERLLKRLRRVLAQQGQS